MLHTTRAVVLRTFKHSDKGTVLKAYTEAFGIRSYMVRTGTRKDRREAALQPLSRVELVVTETGDREMHAVREIRVSMPYLRLHVEHERGLLALFTQEVFYRTLREEAQDPALFAFVMQVLEAMDSSEDLANFPLVLLVELSRHLGICPAPPEPGEDRFDLREGHFFTGDAPHDLSLTPEVSAAFAQLLTTDIGRSSARIPAALRRALLDGLLTYYRLHVEGFGELRSVEVLRAVQGG
jgi:DNA repair protein RecO (recombination protein O)